MEIILMLDHIIKATIPKNRSKNKKLIRQIFLLLTVLIFLNPGQVMASTTVNWPLRIHPGGNYLEDQSGMPFLVVGDSAWSLNVTLSQADILTYLNDRQAKGFTAIIVNVLEHYYSANPPKDGSGDDPFSATISCSDTPCVDFSSAPNTDYWSNLDYIVNQAKQRGILVILAPAYFGYQCGSEGWCANMQAETDAVMQNYGTWIATRYSNQGNILWLNAVDAQCSLYTNGCNRVNDVASAISSAIPGVLQTAESSQDRAALDDYSGQNWLNINGVYSACNTIDSEVQSNYQRSNALPFLVTESGYENGVWKCPTTMTLPIVQHEAMVTYLGGAGLGIVYGNSNVWGFGYGGGYQSNQSWNGTDTGINAPGAYSMSYIGNLLRSREWWKLVPDYANVVVTSNKGSGLSYKATARTNDGATVIIWNPDTGSLPITVDMSKISGGNANVWQWNITTNAATLLGTYATTGMQTFSPPAGTALVIDDASRGYGIPGQSSGDTTPPAAPSGLSIY